MKIVSSLDFNKWDSFVENHPNGNIFQTSEMYNFYKNTKKYDPRIIAVVKDEIILGLLLSVVQKEYDGIIGEFTKRSIIFGGPLVFNNDKEVLNLLLKGYNKSIKRKAIFSETRNQWSHNNIKDIFKDNGFKYSEHLNILFELEKGEERLWKEMTRVRRKGINQAYKKNIVIKEIDLTDEVTLKESHDIIKSVYKRIKLPLHEIDYFRQAKISLGNKLLGFGVFQGDRMVAVRLALCYNSKIFDWYAGALDKFLFLRPNDILPWELMKFGIKNGYKSFDFGGAGKPDVPYGVRDFKLKFGGELVEHGRFQKIHKPLMMSFAKFGLALYKMIK